MANSHGRRGRTVPYGLFFLPISIFFFMECDLFFFFFFF